MMEAMTARSRITGSASMKNGNFPNVRETIVDDRRTRAIPDAIIISPVRNLCHIRETA